MSNSNPDNSTAIVWFRRDLRLNDNPALLAASKRHKTIFPIFIYDIEQDPTLGAASKWWLHHSLQELSTTFEGKLSFFKGRPSDILQQLIMQTGADTIYWNRLYEPYTEKRDAEIESLLKDNIEVQTFAGHLLHEPSSILKKDGTPYKVFTPFYKQKYLNSDTRVPLFSSETAQFNAELAPSSSRLDELQILPAENIQHQFAQHWQPGERAALNRFEDFLDTGLATYKLERDRPDLPSTSRLSPHLHFGEISIRYIWHTVATMLDSAGFDTNYECFLSELTWRDFSHYLLHHFPELPSKNWSSKFERFPWKNPPYLLEKWQQGQTGYPFVDAAMRELMQTGFIHNRVRMIAGSFLVKHLLVDWREGEKWFWQHLLDADLANNSASWQWVAGSGADASPYFRIFNPILQGHKFDPEGKYTRKLVPELAKLPTKYLFSPWEAPEEILKKAEIVLGSTYPRPIVDHSEARKNALAAFANVK